MRSLKVGAGDVHRDKIEQLAWNKGKPRLDALETLHQVRIK